MSVTEDLYGWVAHEHANVHARLVEWARWVRPGLPAAAACRSLEGRYRTPQVENGLAICDECGYTNRVTFTSDCARCGVALPPMPEVAAKPDPIPRLENALKSCGELNDGELEQWTHEIDQEVAEAFRFAEDSPFPPAADAYTDLYSSDSASSVGNLVGGLR